MRPLTFLTILLFSLTVNAQMFISNQSRDTLYSNTIYVNTATMLIGQAELGFQKKLDNGNKWHIYGGTNMTPGFIYVPFYLNKYPFFEAGTQIKVGGLYKFFLATLGNYDYYVAPWLAFSTAQASYDQMDNMSSYYTRVDNYSTKAEFYQDYMVAGFAIGYERTFLDRIKIDVHYGLGYIGGQYRSIERPFTFEFDQQYQQEVVKFAEFPVETITDISFLDQRFAVQIGWMFN